MASAGYKARILNGDFSLSAKLTTISLPYMIDMLDRTVFTDDGNKTFIPGNETSTLSCEGFIDAAAATDSAAWEGPQAFTYGREGLALGSPVTMVDTLKSSYELGSQVAGVSSFSLAGQTTGPTDFGVSLHDLTAETGSSSSTGHDQTIASTTNGGIAHLHVTDFSGFSQVIYTIDDSADNSDWSTIGTFTTATAATSERLVITGTVRRYVRVTWAKTGTGSATFSCAFARRP